VLRPRRPGVLGGLVTLLLVLAGTLAWLGLTALQARSELTAARADLTAARAALVDGETAAAQEALTRAGRRTSRAVDLTSDPLWRLAAGVPGYGNSLQALRGVVQGADRLAAQALPLAVRGAAAVDRDALRRPDGSIDVPMVRAATPDVAAGATAARDVEAQLLALPQRTVVPVLADAQRSFAEQVGELAGVLESGARALELAPLLLGDDRPRRFFVLVQQTAESRGTGGLPGGFAVVETAGGRISVPRAGSRAELGDLDVDPLPDLPVEFVSRYRQLGAFDILVNVNVSPDLPVVGRLLADAWQRSTGQALDGVIALDGRALSLLLQGSGPVEVDGRSIAPEQLEEYLAVGQYVDFAPPTGSAALDLSRERKDALSEVAALTARRLASGGGDTRALLSGLSDAVRSGHLRMTSTDSELGPRLRAAGVDGALPDASRPVAYPVVFNSTGGKLDTFLSRSVSYRAGPCEGTARRSRIEVVLRNDAPAEGLPAYLRVRDDGDGVRLTTDNAVTLSVYATPGAVLTRAALDGRELAPEDTSLPLLSRFEEGGLQGWSLFVDLPRAAPRSLVLELEEPLRAGEALVPEQPLARPLEREVDVPAC
jgi:hypothetical protein